MYYHLMAHLFNSLIPPNLLKKCKAKILLWANNKGSYTNSNSTSSNQMRHKVTPWCKWALVR